MAKRRKAEIKPVNKPISLVQVIEVDDVDTFNRLVAGGISLDASDKTENLFVTAGTKPAILNALTDLSRGLYKQFNDGTTDLHAAAVRGDIDHVQTIFSAEPSRMFEMTVRGESVLNWANYFERYNIISYLVSWVDFVDGLKTKASDDAFYDLARGHELLADYFAKENHLHLVPMYYRIALEFYQSMRDGAQQYIADTNKKLTDFNERYPMVEAAADKGFSCHDVSGDGNCFFNAVADQLLLMPEQKHWSPAELREQAIAYMVEHPDQFKDYCLPDLDAYIAAMVTGGNYADHPVILALSQALMMNFYIVNSDHTDPIIIKYSHDAPCLHFGYMIDNHYQSLQVVEEELFNDVQDEIKRAGCTLDERVSLMCDDKVAVSLCASSDMDTQAASDPDLALALDWNAAWDDEVVVPPVPVKLVRSNAVADLTQCMAQPADTVEFQSAPLGDLLTRVCHDVDDLKKAAMNLGDDFVSYLDTLVAGTDSLNLSDITLSDSDSSILLSRSGSTASLGLTGLFASRPASPVSGPKEAELTQHVPQVLKMSR